MEKPSETKKYQEKIPSNAEAKKEFEPGWKQRALAILPGTCGPIVIDGLTSDRAHYSWNPDVNPGQTLPAPRPAFMEEKGESMILEQFATLRDQEQMNRLAEMIEQKYGTGVGHDIHHLTPKEAIDLAQRILNERTRYDSSQVYDTYIKTPAAKRFPAPAALLLQNGVLTSQEFLSHSLLRRHPNDHRDTESLLKSTKDADGVCRNKAAVTVVIMQVLKGMQDPESSLLGTTSVSYVRSQGISGMGEEVGSMGEDTEVRALSNGTLIGVRPKNLLKSITSLGGGNYDIANGKIWVLSDTEKKAIHYELHLQDMLFQRLENTFRPHAIVQVTTLDRNNRYHVTLRDVTNDKGAIVRTFTGVGNAEETSFPFLPEAILRCKTETTWSAIAEACGKLRSIPSLANDRQIDDHFLVAANEPLIHALAAQHQELTTQKQEELAQQYDKKMNEHMAKVKRIGNNTSYREYDFFLNVTLFFLAIHDMPRAQHAFDACQEPALLKKWKSLPRWKDFRGKIEHIRRLLDGHGDTNPVR